MDEVLLQDLHQRIQAASRIVVASHIRPDGDAIGSLLGLGLSLQAAGKQVQMVLADKIPGIFHHLEGWHQIRSQAAAPFDLSIILDCSDLSRLGNALNGYSGADINIDHHPTNEQFGRINLLEVEAVATAEIVAQFLERFDYPLAPAVADTLLYGIITDTLGFRTYNMTPRALRVAADLVQAGGDLPGLYYRAFLRRSFEAARFWGAGLSELKRQGRLLWTILTQDDRRAAGYSGRDDADLISLLTTIEDIDVVMVFVEQVNGIVKISWRSQPGFDVSKVALQFGGGGHAAAAGAEVAGSLEAVQAIVVETTKRALFANGRADNTIA